ncbi:Intraflagellar transport protein 57 homolog [Eumeta japonica]|uniref:Intraflagellar transport protein 57 homolog n=1 Tax=Eumeta variegata TaxID=151549 RepID=A0A4C2A471_EUMVA|nr:Intraflagellar transport protein 57 homolog [Eumeta japonica]
MKLTCQRLHIADEDEIANDYLEDNAEIILEKIEDEQMDALSDDGSELDLNQNSLRQWGLKRQRRVNDYEGNSLQVSDKLTDQQTWRLEFEEVMPQLKVYIKKAVTKIKDDVAHLNLEVALLINGIDRDILKRTQSGMDSEKFI